jgi:serine protease Do
LLPAFAQPDPPKPPRPPRNSRVVIQNAGSSFLGVGVSEIDSERAKALNLKEERGVEIKNVDEESPAAKGGVKVGDVVLDFNGQRVEGTEQFVRFVRETPVGRQVKLLISRGGATQTITADIGSRPSNMIYVGGDDFTFKMPEVRIPDIPRSVMSWQSRSLGVESESLSSQLAEFFGVKEGVLVRAVIKGTAAEKAGLKAGDVITRIGDKKVTSPKDISNALRSVTAGKAFPITVMRDRKEMTVNATIEEKSSGGARKRAVPIDL